MNSQQYPELPDHMINTSPRLTDQRFKSYFADYYSAVLLNIEIIDKFLQSEMMAIGYRETTSERRHLLYEFSSVDQENW